MVKETQRLYPATSLLIREACEDVEVQGVLIRKGTTATIPLQALQRRGEDFKDPGMPWRRSYSLALQSKDAVLYRREECSTVGMHCSAGGRISRTPRRPGDTAWLPCRKRGDGTRGNSNGSSSSRVPK